MSTTQAEAIGVTEIDSRIDAYPWPDISKHLDAYGWAMLENVLTASECDAVAGLYAEHRHFRSHIVMARHGFGRGEYKYFSYPLPDTVAALRTALYRRLAPIANTPIGPAWVVLMALAPSAVSRAARPHYGVRNDRRHSDSCCRIDPWCRTRAFDFGYHAAMMASSSARR